VDALHRCISRPPDPDVFGDKTRREDPVSLKGLSVTD